MAVLGLAPLSFHAERRFETGAYIEGSEAQSVDRELAVSFRSPYVNRAVLVVRGLPPVDTGEGRAYLNRIVEALQQEPGISGISSYLDMPDPVFVGLDGGTFLILGLPHGGGSVETVVAGIRARLETVRHSLRPRYPAATLELTGEALLNYDLRKVSSDDVRAAEFRALPLMILLLFIAFGSFVGALMPVGVGLLAISVTLGSAVLFAGHWRLSILIQNLASMLGLGLGVDYALLMVSRFREALAAGHGAAGSAYIAARQAGHTLLISAATVAIGFAALMTVPINELRSIGLAGFLVAGASLLLATTLLPAALAVLGARIDLGLLPVARRWNPDFSAAARERWRGWGRKMTARPWTALALAGLPLMLLASQAIRLDTSGPRGDWLPAAAESVRALHSLEAMDRGGIVQSLRVILELPAGSGPETEAGWNALSTLTTRLADDPRADRVISLATLTSGDRDELASVAEDTRRSFMRGDGRATLLELLPASSVSPVEQVRWVRELRRASVADLTGVPGAAIRIGGIPALNADYQSVVGDRLPSVIVMVVFGTFVALLLGFRAVFVAVKAIGLNLLSVGAAVGALVLVFQDGHGSVLLGVPGGTGGVFPIVPILTFAIVFGLSMDYEVFLVARVLEARRSGHSEVEAIAAGLAGTGGLITSAAAIMIVVFGAFTFGGFLVIKMLGFALAVAVLIDATLVRMVIGPALLYLAGDWNWWPWGLAGRNRARLAEAGR